MTLGEVSRLRNSKAWDAPTQDEDLKIDNHERKDFQGFSNVANLFWSSGFESYKKTEFSFSFKNSFFCIHLHFDNWRFEEVWMSKWTWKNSLLLLDTYSYLSKIVIIIFDDRGATLLHSKKSEKNVLICWTHQKMIDYFENRFNTIEQLFGLCKRMLFYLKNVNPQEGFLFG